MPFRFVDKVEENIVDRPSNRGPEIEELSVDPVKGGLQKIAFSWILRIEEFQEVQDKKLIDIPLGNVRAEIGTFDKPQEELVNDLEMRPCELQDGFVLFGIKCIASRIHGRGYRTEEVGSELVREVRHDGWLLSWKNLPS